MIFIEPSLSKGLVVRDECAVRNELITDWKASFAGAGGTIASSRSRKMADGRSSALNLSNAPNRLLSALLQQALGGEFHETCFCTCWPRRAGRRCTLYRGRLYDAGDDSGSGLAGFQRSTGRLRLHRMGPLLAS